MLSLKPNRTQYVDFSLRVAGVLTAGLAVVAQPTLKEDGSVIGSPITVSDQGAGAYRLTITVAGSAAFTDQTTLRILIAATVNGNVEIIPLDALVDSVDESES